MNFDNFDGEMDCEPNEEVEKAMDELVESLIDKYGPEYIHRLGTKLIARALKDYSEAMEESQPVIKGINDDSAWREFELDQARTCGSHSSKCCNLCSKIFENTAKEAFYLYDKHTSLIAVLCEGCYKKSGGD